MYDRCGREAAIRVPVSICVRGWHGRAGVGLGGMGSFDARHHAVSGGSGPPADTRESQGSWHWPRVWVQAFECEGTFSARCERAVGEAEGVQCQSMMQHRPRAPGRAMCPALGAPRRGLLVLELAVCTGRVSHIQCRTLRVVAQPKSGCGPHAMCVRCETSNEDCCN